MSKYGSRAKEYLKRKEQSSLSKDNLLSRTGLAHEYMGERQDNYTSLYKKWDDLYKRANDYYNNDSLTGFYDSYNGVVGKDGYVGKNDAGRWYRDLEKQKNTANEGVEELLAELDQYSRYYNEAAVKYVRDLITERQKSYDDVMTEAGKFRDHWSQWATEDDYNNAVWESDFYSKLQDGNFADASAMYKDLAGSSPNNAKLSEYGEYLKAAKNNALINKYKGMSAEELLAEKERLEKSMPSNLFNANPLTNEAAKNSELMLELQFVSQLYDETALREKYASYDVDAGQADIDFLRGYAERAKEIKSQIAAIDGKINQARVDGRNVDALLGEKMRLQMSLYQLSEEYRDATTSSVEKAHEKLTGKSENKYGINTSATDYYDVVDFDALLSQAEADHTNAKRNKQNVLLSTEPLTDPEFNEKSVYIPSERVNLTWWEQNSKFLTRYGYLDSLGYGDTLHEYINGDDNVKSGIETAFKQDEQSASADSDSNSNVPTISGTLVSQFYDEYGKYAHMTEDQKAIYNYYYNTQGKEAAARYLNSIEEYLNASEAKDIYERLKDEPTLVKQLYSIPVGFDQFKTGLAGIFSEGYTPASPTQMTGQKVREDLADEGILRWYNFKTGEWEDKFFGSSSAQMLYDIGSTTSNMLPSILTSAAIGVVSKTAGAAAGAALLGASAGGNAKTEMLNLGYSKDQANAYGLLVGASEAGLSYIMSGIPGLRGGDGVASGILTKILGKIDNALAKVAIAFGGVIDEGVEEGLQTVLEGWFKEIATGVDFEDPSADEILYSSLLGMLNSAGMNAGGAAINGIGSAISKQNTFKTEGGKYKSDPEALINEALKLDPNNEYALELKAKLESGKNISRAALGKLSFGNIETVGKTLTDRDAAAKEQANKELVTKTEKRLSGKIENTETRVALAESLAKAIEGEHVSNAEIRKIAKNQAALNVLNDELGTRFKTSNVKVSDVRQAISQKQSNSTKLSTENILSRYSAFYDMDEAAERSLMVNYAADVKNAENGKAINPEDYAAVYGLVYAAGKKGADVSKISADAAKVLSPNAMAQAYKAGQNAAKVDSQADLQSGENSGIINKNAQEVQDEQGVYLREGGERNRGQNTQGQIPGMEGYAGQDQSRREGRARPRDSEAASLSYDRKEVNAQTLGIKGGLKAGSVRLVAEGSETESTKQAKRIADERGLNLVLFGGGNLKIKSETGNKIIIINARAYIDGKNVYVRADHPDFTADQLMMHEAGHDMIAKGEVKVADVRKLINERFTPEEIDAISKTYAMAYAKTGLTTDEIWEEVICDSLAGMNVFEGVEGYEASAEMAADFLPELKEATLESKKEARAPPKAQEGKASIDIGGQNENEENLNSRILEGREISTANRSGNNIRKYSKNTRTLQGLVGLSNSELQKVDFRAGESGWIESYHGELGVVDSGEIQRMRRFLQRFRRKLSETKLKDTDTVGRKLPAYVRDNFSETVFKTEDGKILSLWHWTNQIFDEFKYGDIGFHAGSLDASHAIMFGKHEKGSTSVFKELYFNSKNPLFIERDLGTAWTPYLVSVVSNVLNSSEVSEIYSLDGSTRQQYDSTAAFRLRQMLKNKGYDSIIYINGWEGGLSVIAFDNEQFYTVAENGIDVEKDTHGKASQDLFEDMDENVTAEEDVPELSDRERLAAMFESDDMSPSQKGLLTKYKNKLSDIEANEAKIAEMTEELDALKKNGKGNTAKAAALENKIRTLEKQNAVSEGIILNIEAAKPIKRLLERERRAAYQEGLLAGQMAQGKDTAPKLRKTEEELATTKQKGKEKLAEYKRLAAQRESEALLAGQMAQGKKDAEILRKTEEELATQKQKSKELRQKRKDDLDALAKRYQESRAKSVEQRRKTDIRNKIKEFKDKLQNTLKHPTERKYIPGALAQAMIDVCALIDTDTELYKADGTVNKAQEKRNETRERLAALREQYKEIKKNADPLYEQEYDEQVAEYLEQLENKFKGKSLSEMSLSELSEMYGYLRSIDETLRNARKLIGEKEAADAYDAGNKIIEEQRSIAAKRKNGERGAIKKLDDGISNQSLSPVRRVLEISGYDENSPLYKLFQSFERGVRSSEFFKMQAIKSFDPLTSGKKNAAIYENAVYEADGGDIYTDVNGRKFGISKMQKMQAVLSYERETTNKKTHHIDKGGLVFADLKSLRDGNLRAATSSEKSHKVSGESAVKLIEKFKQELANDRWAQEYMTTARVFFNETAKNAINDTYMKLKHRILATENAYIPFEVDQSSIVREISAQYDIQKTISSYGMLKDVQSGSVNPLIMTGLNNILDRHIDQVGTIQGLAVPIRNFNKVWNVKSVDGATNVREQIEKTAGRGAIKVIEQTVQDIQGERIRSDGFEPATRTYKKIKSNYIGTQFFWNGSVMLKQLGSMFSATSKIRYRDPVRMMGNFIATMANRKKISAEVDKYTASAWMRGQGLSDAEIKTLSTERKRGWFGKAIQSGSKGMIYMDQTVALSLWKYCKQDVAKKTGLRGDELLKATAEYYDEVIETTQSMSDVLHRPEIQRSGGIGTELLGTFKTDLYQNAGNLRVAIGEFVNNKTQENATKLVKAVGAAMSSAVWGSIVTSLMAMIRYKVNRYRDEEDDELTAESWLKEQGTDLLEELVGYLIPLGGSEIFEAVRGLKEGKNFGNVLASAIPYDAVNDLYSDIAGLYQKLTTGKELTKSDYNNLIRDCGNVLGIPTANIMRMLQAVQLHKEDILNGEFLSFEAGLEDPNAYRLYKAILEGDADKIDKASRNYKNQEAITKAIRSQLRERDPRIREAAAELVNGNIAEYEKIFNDIYGEDNFEFKDILQAIYSEEESYYSKITDAATAKYHSDTEEYESVLDEIFERWENVLDEDRILSDIDAMEKTVAEGDDAVEEKISMFKAKHINIAFDNGDEKTALSVIEDIISLKVENALAQAERKASLTGETFDEEEVILETEDKAKSTLRSTLTKYWKPKYQQAYASGDSAEMNRIEDILYTSGLYEYKSGKTVDDVLEDWIDSYEE